MDIQKEIEFWSLIMRDHGIFQLTSFAPEETDAIKQAVYFIQLFEQLNEEARGNVRTSDLMQKAKEAVKLFIDFKRYLLKGLLTCNMKLGMPPSFLNHMINEAFEFLNVLDLAEETIPYNPTLENIRLHKVWLPDASGHASSIAADLDATEAQLIKEAESYSEKFDQLFKKAFEMYTMYERTGLENGALHYFNQVALSTMSDFIQYLEKVEELRANCKIFAMGTFSELFPNHMIREEEYYSYKIEQFLNR